MNRELSLAELQRWLEESPYHRLLGIKAISFDAVGGEAVLRLPFRDDLCRSDDAQEIHGGVTAGLIDIAGDFALAVAIGHTTPTVNMRVDYLRMARGSALTATARVVKAGRSLGFVDVSVTDGEGREVAIGRCNYSTRRD